jgi:hypothetical protein
MLLVKATVNKDKTQYNEHNEDESMPGDKRLMPLDLQSDQIKVSG